MGEGAEETLKETLLLAPSVSNVPSSHSKRDWSIRLTVCLQKKKHKDDTQQDHQHCGQNVNWPGNC